MEEKIIFFHNSKTHTRMTLEKAKEIGRPFCFYDENLGFCAPASTDDPPPVAGHGIKDYSKDNPLTPERNKEFATDMKVTSHRRLFSNESSASIRDYSKDNPLTPEKKDRRNTADGEERNSSDNPLSPYYKEKKTIQRSILAP
jgi:hypothetical protein